MKTIRTVLLAICLLLSPLTTQASSITYQLTGDGIGSSVTIDDETPGYISFLVEVVASPNTGDLRGVFFDLTPFPASLSASDIFGSLVTGVVVDQDAVTKTSLSNVMNPYGPFDVGVEIGTPGMGRDDIQSASFMMADLGAITLAHFGYGEQPFGIRMTSVGMGDLRNESRKLVGGIPGGGPNSVPEPASMLLIVAGVTGLLGIRRNSEA